MVDGAGTDRDDLDGNELLLMLAALAHPQRLRIIGALAGRRVHVSQLARELRISRPLLYLHLQKLEAVGLVAGKLELSPDGKALKFFEVVSFAVRLTPARIADAVTTLAVEQKGDD